jgi:hypothetical protein
VAQVVHRHDSQCGVLANIISNAIKSAFSEFAQQQRYERTYYQQQMTSTNTAFSYDPIQQQGYDDIYPGSSSTTIGSPSTVPRLAYDDCLMPLHQHNSYQPMKTPQTVQVLSTSQLLTQGDLFRALGYTPQPLA